MFCSDTRKTRTKLNIRYSEVLGNPIATNISQARVILTRASTLLQLLYVKVPKFQNTISKANAFSICINILRKLRY